MKKDKPIIVTVSGGFDPIHIGHKKKLIIFDLDGTLTESKAVIDQKMSALLCQLLKKKKVAVIGGGSWEQFKKQFLANFKCESAQLKNLFIFPTSGSAFYRHKNNKWIKVYQLSLNLKEIEKIMSAFRAAFRELHYKHPFKTHGKIIENRGSQITFSALGQKAPVEKKQQWHDTADRRLEMKAILERYLPNFETRLGGLTSIDVTRKGIDKGYGIRQISKFLRISKNDMIFAGDALYEGGNDYAVKRAGVATIEVKDAEETKIFIRSMLSSLNNEQN
ncbi:MAG: HAD-IIB family hydrolase [Patescibacteria group bacterium]